MFDFSVDISIPIWLHILFYTIVAIQVIYCLFFFSRIYFFKQHKSTVDYDNLKSLSVSILIPVSNYNPEHIIKFIDILNKAPRINYELVLIMYTRLYPQGISFDDIKSKHAQIKIVELHQESTFIVGNKYAIAIGVKSATYDHILLTQENCIPDSHNWVANMLQKFDDNTQLILSVFNYRKESSLFNKFVRFENTHYAMQYLSYALANNPVMGTVNNIAFTKKAFFSNKDFSLFNNFIGGENTLFVSTMATNFNTKVDYRKESTVNYDKKINFKQWFFNKKIYVSTLKYYGLNKKIMIAPYILSYMLFYPILIIIFSLDLWNEIILYCVVARFVIYYLIMSLSLCNLKERNLVKWLPIMDIMMVGYYYLISTKYFKNPRTVH